MALPSHKLDPKDLPVLQWEATQDVLALNYLAPLGGNYLPWSSYAIRPSGLVQILNALLLRRQLTVVECGGGISTFYIARLFRQQNLPGHLYCLENNKEWLELLDSLLKKEGLEGFVTLIHAPLIPCQLALEGLDWYGTQAIRQAIPESLAINALLVDGPPAYEPRIQYARFPALPFFLPQLAPGATVVLDDCHRAGETEIVRRWQSLINVQFDTAIGGVAIAHLPGS